MFSQRALTVKSWHSTSFPATASRFNVSIIKSVIFARSSYAKNKGRKLNLMLDEKFNIIAGHSSSILHSKVVSK